MTLPCLTNKKQYECSFVPLREEFYFLIASLITSITHPKYQILDTFVTVGYIILFFFFFFMCDCNSLRVRTIDITRAIYIATNTSATLETCLQLTFKTYSPHLTEPGKCRSSSSRDITLKLDSTERSDRAGVLITRSTLSEYCRSYTRTCVFAVVPLAQIISKFGPSPLVDKKRIHAPTITFSFIGDH